MYKCKIIDNICIEITIIVIGSYIFQHVNSQEFSDYYDTGENMIPDEQDEAQTNMHIPKKLHDVSDQISARDLLVYLSLNGGERDLINKQGNEEPEYIEFETPVQDSRYTKASTNYGDYFEDLTEGNQEFRKKHGKFSKKEKDNIFRRGFDTPLANLYHQFVNSSVQASPAKHGNLETADHRPIYSPDFNQYVPGGKFNEGSLNFHQNSRIPTEMPTPMKAHGNVDRITEVRRKSEYKTKPVNCITSNMPTPALTEKDKHSFLADSTLDYEKNPHYLTHVKRRQYETETVFGKEEDENMYLYKLKEEFYKVYNGYVLAIDSYYRKRTVKHAENVERIYKKILQAFRRYYIAFKEANPTGSMPKYITNSLMAAQKVDMFFKKDKQSKHFRRSITPKKTSTRDSTYQEAKRNYLLAVKYYLKSLNQYEKNPTNIYFQNAVNSYKIVLDTHGFYRKEYKRQKKLKGTGDHEFEGRLLKETEITDPPIPLPEDPSSSVAERYKVARLKYLGWIMSYLQTLISFYQLNGGISEKTVNNEYDKLRSRFEEYQEFYERLLSHDALPVEEKTETFIKLPDAPVLHQLTTEIKDRHTVKILRQHDQARLSYYKQFLEYMSELWYVYSDDSNTKHYRLITALNEYKKLNDFRKIYHDVYLYIYDNKMIDSKKYPFPNTPDLFTVSSRLPIQIKVEHFSKADFLLLIERTEQKRKEYRRLVDSYANDPDNEVMYRTAVVSYEDLVRTYALQDYIYRHRPSFAKYDKPRLSVNLKTEIEKLKTPKFMVLPAPVDPKQQAEMLSRETRPEVLSEKIKQLEAEYRVVLLIYNALSDLLQGYIKKEGEESVIDFEMASHYRTLNILYDLCNHLNDFLDGKTDKCTMLPLPKRIS